MNKQSLAECSSEAILTCHQYLAEIIGDFPASKVLEAAIEELPESSPLRAIKFGDGVGEKELGNLFARLEGLKGQIEELHQAFRNQLVDVIGARETERATERIRLCLNESE
ncbi:hypothetical protein A3F28_00290 [Candidatus Uhrbacteria bacterium RIFCSPHIGHO2_12_FULL_57_11]|uniref:Uncharacterized protein n=3 Tax=Parcubacteria group TaxID=1794811 RepID=A0A1F7UNK7_9BACT|nr:MAG: hypothetical protein A2704_01620 [Candidatus Kaiserbacteria bacterium RIFCSPHIGHO2_01_FULL_54_36b]OGL72269.1 MAG: hypothetical protein A3D72_02765 [Candidatus Uhrbacteria bacterium RIFCSPHIGHO2_02_FULL_57_19]OGL79856.1 MAG: hypothetical protein A3F28_00290 [Candidatus Uhrbacteria bacterium RIFCSPHIGHO2_12_FULL_57_11]